MHPSLRAIYQGLAPGCAGTGLGFGDNVALDPGAKVRAFGNVILLLAGFGAQAATDAPVRINRHDPLVLRRIITFGRAGAYEDLLDRRLGGAGQRSRHQPGEGRADLAEDAAAGGESYPASSSGGEG